jgi:hypothetical protein
MAYDMGLDQKLYAARVVRTRSAYSDFSRFDVAATGVSGVYPAPL